MGEVEVNAGSDAASQNICDGDAQNNSIQDNARRGMTLLRRRFLPTPSQALAVRCPEHEMEGKCKR